MMRIKMTAVLFAVMGLASCRLFFGPEVAISVDITLNAVTVIGETSAEDEWSYTVQIEAGDLEWPLAVGETVSFESTTWEWVKFRMKVTEENVLLDRGPSLASSLLGRDILAQSSYEITREIEVSDASDEAGSVIWRFEFSLDSTEL
ncbi:MAG: hypothetical protein KOO61_03520 [Spirochaetales bacterium]|nr:hypothetical protein [Spirochaetales bacterium]